MSVCVCVLSVSFIFSVFVYEEQATVWDAEDEEGDEDEGVWLLVCLSIIVKETETPFIP